MCLLELVAGSVLTDAPPAVWGPSLLVATLWPSVWPCVTLCVVLWPSVWLPDLRFGVCCYALDGGDDNVWDSSSVTICVASSFGNFETKSSSINQYLLVTSQWPSPTRFWMDLRDYEFYDVLLWVNKDCQLRALWRERDSETWAIEKWPDLLCRLFWSSGHRGSHLCVAFSLLGCVISSVCCFSDSSTCLKSHLMTLP